MSDLAAGPVAAVVPEGLIFTTCARYGPSLIVCSAEDTLEAELMRELENGRLVRLMAKFGFINERPE